MADSRSLESWFALTIQTLDDESYLNGPSRLLELELETLTAKQIRDLKAEVEAAQQEADDERRARARVRARLREGIARAVGGDR